MSSASEISRSSKPTVIDDMSNLSIVASASKSAVSTVASEQEGSTTPSSQETVSAPPSSPEVAQAQAGVHAKPEQLGSDKISKENTQDITMVDIEESRIEYSEDDQIPHDGGSELWKAIRLKKDEIKRYEAMIEEELKGDKPGKERRLGILRATLAQQTEARLVFLRKQAEVDRQGRNLRWG